MNEFTLINKYLKSLSLKNKNALNLSDDIFFDYKKKFAISVDTYVHGVHFVSKDPSFFLKKTIRSSLSDLYCKGIKPDSYFLSISANKNLISKKWLSKVSKILRSEQRKFKIVLSGGDTTKSTKLSITIVVLGSSKIKPILRRTCMLNDDIYVTGNIGDSFLGLGIIKKKFNFGKWNKFFLKSFYEPELPFKLQPYLHKIASSSIDISDGLLQDLSHICFFKKLGAIIYLKKIPLSFSSRYLVNSGKIKVKNIFSRGDDYQFLFTSNPNNRKKINNLSKKISLKITRIGKINNHRNITFKDNDEIFDARSIKMGYMHNF